MAPLCIGASARFNGAPEKVTPGCSFKRVPEKLRAALVQTLGRVPLGAGKGSREGLGCFGAEPCHKVREKDLQKVPEDLGAARFNGSGMIPGECRRSS